MQKTSITKRIHGSITVWKTSIMQGKACSLGVQVGVEDTGTRRGGSLTNFDGGSLLGRRIFGTGNGALDQVPTVRVWRSCAKTGELFWFDSQGSRVSGERLVFFGVQKGVERETVPGTEFKGMVKVKGVEWNHVVVLKEPEKHGMATLVRCAHCEKEFQGNAMRIRAHLLGNKRAAGVSGCPSCPEEAREELRIIDHAKSLTKRKRETRNRTRGATSSASDHSLDSAQQQQQQQQQQHVDLMTSLQNREKITTVEHALKSMVFQAGGLPVNFVNLSPFKPPPVMAPIDLETFFEGFGVRPETVVKIKEMGFTGQTFMSNLDELPSLLESIKQHCHLTLGEEWGIKGAAKKLQKDHLPAFTQQDGEKWPEPENGKEVLCISQS